LQFRRRCDNFSNDPSVKVILQNPVDHIESAEFISWERFFTYLLSEISKDKPKLNYPKDKSKCPSGYLTDDNIDSIINAINNKKARRRRAFFISSSLNLTLPNPSFCQANPSFAVYT